MEEGAKREARKERKTGRKIGKDINSKPGGMKVIMEGKRKTNRGRERRQRKE